MKTYYLLILALLNLFSSALLTQEGNAASGSSQLSDLDRYRLWRVRDAAVKNQDLRAIEKLVETEGLVRKESDRTVQGTAQLRKLINELEARLKTEPVASVPADLQPQDYAFAVPRRERLDVRFANTDGAEAKAQSLDVYAPVGGGEHPIIVWLHGGGMKGGDKAQAGVMVVKPDYFLARGYVFASVNYRLAPTHKHPAQAEDTAAALAWLHDHASEFGGDAQSIIVIGISAGAQLAAVVSTNERFLAHHNKSLSIIKGAVILDIGSFDIPTLMQQAGERAPDMYHYAFRDGGTREDWTDCSPFYHVASGKGIPPMLLYYVAGREHHAEENARFAERLKAAGCEATALAAQDKTHLRIELEIGTADDVPTSDIMKFVDQHTHRE